MNKIIAVDFDGCLCEANWPNIGRPNTPIIQQLISMKNDGTKIILNTCRVGTYLDEAVEWCKSHGLLFDAVNENLPEQIAQYGADCRKISADEYWDDKAVRTVFTSDSSCDQSHLGKQGKISLQEGR